MDSKEKYTEQRLVTIYGYSESDLSAILRHFESQLPEHIALAAHYDSLITRISLTGVGENLDLIKFEVGRLQKMLQDLFEEEFISSEDKSISQILGELLTEKELTFSSAESCTGGNIAHSIVQIPGSSVYFMGSVVSYSNDVKADVLGVSRSAISRHGAVSKEVVEQMAAGAARLMRTNCAIATSGIAGPDGGSKFKPVGTVWFAVKYNDTVVSECVRFDGDRNEVIQSATNHGIVMLIKLLRNRYTLQEDINDD